MKIQTKRVYEPPTKEDGFRVLADRLWPRGVSKKAAQIDLWLKEVAPSTPLRKWFAHDAAKWAGFCKRYFRELAEHPDAIALIKAKARKGKVTLVYGAKDERHNNAVAFKRFLESHGRNAGR